VEGKGDEAVCPGASRPCATASAPVCRGTPSRRSAKAAQGCGASESLWEAHPSLYGASLMIALKDLSPGAHGTTCCTRL
jgi:hypothetical protein